MVERERSNRILLAIDGSDQSMNAVKYVSVMMPPERTEVVLFNVNSEPRELYQHLEENPLYRSKLTKIRSWRAEQHKSISNTLNNAFHLLVNAGFPHNAVKMKSQSLRKDITSDIVQESYQEYNAAVPGRPGLGKIKDAFIGSVATKLVGKIKHIPLIVVGGEPLSKKVLMAFDGSEGALRSVAHLGDLTGGNDGSVTLFSVLRSLGTLEFQAKRAIRVEDEMGWLEANQDKLDKAIGDAKDSLVRAGYASGSVNQEIIAGKMSRAGSIVEKAKGGGYDTIVAGRRRFLHFVEEFVLGRVSLKILQLADRQAVWIVS